MLAEGFLRQLCYSEERKDVSNQKEQKTYRCSDSEATDLRGNSLGLGAKQDDLDFPEVHGLRVCPQHPAALAVPGCSPIQTHYPVSIEDCSLLNEYPDLQVADSAGIPNNLLIPSPLMLNTHPQLCTMQEPQADLVALIPNQGYLVMGARVDSSLEPGLGLEPMSNSVLNGLLEKQLEEVYMQHLTDNLARSDPCLENSLLRGLVARPPPRTLLQENDSLGTSLDRGLEDRHLKKSYLSNQNLFHCSSNFSSPVLRISEADDTQ